MDSINKIMLMTMMEKELGISLEQHAEALTSLSTIGDIVTFAESMTEDVLL